MIHELKVNSYVSYVIISILFLVIFSSTIVLINTEKSFISDLNTINQLKTSSQRVLLLSHLYQKSSYNASYETKIIKHIKEMKTTTDLMKKSPKNKITSTIYGKRYNFAKQLNQYSNNIERFITTHNEQYLKTANYLNNSILSTTNTIVNVLQNNYKKFVLFFQLLILLLFIISILTLVFTYKYVSLKSFENAEISFDKLMKSQDEVKFHVKTLDDYVITCNIDMKGNITNVSKAFCKISGYTKEELIGVHNSIVRHPDTTQEFVDDLCSTIQEGEVWMGELKKINKDGKTYWVEVIITPHFNENGEKFEYSNIYKDISDKKYVEQLVITDGLTGLYNKRHFSNIAQKEINRAKRDNTIFALVMVDIDNFKKYNDTYGHQAGDSALINVAKSLAESFKRSSDMVFRLGGEEFGIIVHSDSIDKINPMIELARENIKGLKIKHKSNSPQNVVTASFGIAIINPSNKSKNYNIDDIYRLSDKALYEAKNNGRNTTCVKEV